MKTKVVTRVVTAPQNWHCDGCMGTIPAGEQCVKMGSKKYCMKCIKKEIAK